MEVGSSLSIPRHHFHDGYSERAILSGSVTTLRLIQPTDHDLWVDFFQHLSQQTRYLRFCAAKNGVSEQEISYFTRVDQESHFAIVAVMGEPTEERLVGVARFIRLATDPTMAEAAVTVMDDAQGHGLGFLLLLRLIAAARERGVGRFLGTLLASNDRVLHLIRENAPSYSLKDVSEGEIVLEINLPPVKPDESWEHLHGVRRDRKSVV